jgi:hypothetical protein
MKVCVIFRGDNVREAAHIRKYIDVLMCWDNLKKTIYDDLTNNGHECDIVFITYCSKIVEDIKNIIAPTHIEIKERINQSENFKNVLSFMNKYKNTYDRFVILRCDFMYRINITTWPKWDKNGIILVNKDVHWPTYKLYADIMFIVDSTSVDTFTNAYYSNIFRDSIHGLGCFLYNNSIPFHLMYEDYYHMNIHPLHSMGSLEDIPDLANPLPIEPIKDVSYWNKHPI